MRGKLYYRAFLIEQYPARYNYWLGQYDDRLSEESHDDTAGDNSGKPDSQQTEAKSPGKRVALYVSLAVYYVYDIMLTALDAIHFLDSLAPGFTK